MTDREEWASAVASLSEMERAVACGHSARVGFICPDCGERAE